MPRKVLLHPNIPSVLRLTPEGALDLIRNHLGSNPIHPASDIISLGGSGLVTLDCGRRSDSQGGDSEDDKVGQLHVEDVSEVEEKKALLDTVQQDKSKEVGGESTEEQKVTWSNGALRMESGLMEFALRVYIKNVVLVPRDFPLHLFGP
jgi:hypothetical protein